MILMDIHARFVLDPAFGQTMEEIWRDVFSEFDTSLEQVKIEQRFHSRDGEGVCVRYRLLDGEEEIIPYEQDRLAQAFSERVAELNQEGSDEADKEWRERAGDDEILRKAVENAIENLSHDEWSCPIKNIRYEVSE